MSEITDVNGNALRGETVITLKYQHDSGKLELGGDLSNLDRVLNMLGQAERYLKTRYDFQQMQMAMMQAQEEQRLIKQAGRLIS